MATNEILNFCSTDTGTNLLSQSDYALDTQRPIGNQPGTARSQLVNKVLRQTSSVCAGFGQFLANTQSTDITDGLTTSQLSDIILNAIRGSTYFYGTSSSSANTYTATIANAALITGQIFYIKFSNTNTGSSTLNINSLGAKSIKTNFGIDLVASQLPTLTPAVLLYDGTNFILQNPANNTIGFTAVMSANQSVNPNTSTKIQFDTTEFDTHGYFDKTTSFSYKPLVPGYYAFSATTTVDCVAGVSVALQVYKNNTEIRSTNNTSGAPAGTYSTIPGYVLYMNGSTDFVDIRVQHTDTLTRSIYSTAGRTWFSGFKVN